MVIVASISRLKIPANLLLRHDPMEIRLIETSVMDLQYSPSTEGGEEDVRCRPVYREDQPSRFAVIYEVTAAFRRGGWLKLKYFAVFETSEAIGDEFRKSHFPRVNAPAVAYPYVRAFIAQFSSLVGAETYTLPVRNFVKTPPPALSVPEPALPETASPSGG